MISYFIFFIIFTILCFVIYIGYKALKRGLDAKKIPKKTSNNLKNKKNN
tara:strand:- start:63 stop:209 length:147 start_codon:yes stop_codon:yes gene_type:complete